MPTSFWNSIHHFCSFQTCHLICENIVRSCDSKICMGLLLSFSRILMRLLMSSTHLNTLGFRDKVKWTLETCLATVCSWTTEIISALCSQVKNSHCFSLPEEKNSLSPLPTKTQLLASHKIDYFWNICFMCRFLLLILFFF